MSASLRAGQPAGDPAVDEAPGGSPIVFGAGPAFAALPPESTAFETARAVLIPVPYDATTTFRAGTRDGPRAIIDASRELELYDMELDCEPAEVGIHTLGEVEPHLGDPARMVERVHDVVAAVLAAGKLPLLLGGEHTLSVGAVRACAARWPDLAILYLDAHADVRGPYLGARYNHASALRLVLEERLLTGRREGAGQAGSRLDGAVAAGVRSMAREEAEFIRQSGLAVVSAADFAAARRGGTAAFQRLCRQTLAHLGRPGRPLYVSLDLDVFDPGLLPAVGTPEPGGLDWYEVLGLLRAAAVRHPIVMADVVELAPGEGPVASAFTAAKLVYKLIGYVLAGPRRWDDVARPARPTA